MRQILRLFFAAAASLWVIFAFIASPYSNKNVSSVHRAIADVEQNWNAVVASTESPGANSQLRYRHNVGASATPHLYRGEAFESAAKTETKARWRILVFGNQRVDSLARLCRSLSAAHINETVPLNFYLEANQPPEMYELVQNFEWPHGPVQINARHSPGGLINAIIEGWFPSHDSEWAFFLEDDIEVSPYFLTYAQAARSICEDTRGCIGVSLYSPMMDELVKPKTALTKKLLDAKAGPLYTAQLPCSWGAVYAPGPWRQFRKWSIFQSREGKYGGDLEIGQASGWAASWKRYLLELMLVMDWTMLYPFIDGSHAAYSTNHVEIGEHISVQDQSLRRSQYEHPLLNVPPPFFVKPAVHFDHLYSKIGDRIEKLLITKTRGMKNRRPTGCAAYNPQGHRVILDHEPGVTIVVTFFYTAARFRPFLKNIQTYCTYSIVKRIVVMWHNRVYYPQHMAWCGKDSKTSVHFFMPRIKDTLSNRFIPTLRIRTRAVMTVDDDILASERDIRRMVTVLHKTNYTRVVGPFPRWYRLRGPGKLPQRHYLFKPLGDVPDGYPMVLTKLHISNVELFYRYFCDPKYQEMRDFVSEVRNAEDLLYIKVASDYFIPPALFVLTVDTVVDTGRVGIHSSPDADPHKHQDDRSKALDFFDFNTSFWTTDVVLAPGTEISNAYSPDLWTEEQHKRIAE